MIQLSNEQTMSSREIADLTNKLHKNVLVDCEKLNESYLKLGLAEISADVYKDNYGREQKCFLLTRIQTFDLMTGYNIELRIKVNRRWEELEQKNKLDFSNPETVLQLAQNWKNEYDLRLKAEKQIKVLAPKAELMDRVLDTDTNIDVGQVAKILELPFGRNILFEKLRQNGIFFKNRNEPKQEYVERGFFKLKEKIIYRNEHDSFVVIKVLVTQRGLEFISKMFQTKPVQKKLALIS